MPVSPAAVLSACQQVDAAVRSDHRYAHNSAFRVVIDGEVAYAARYRGPAVAEVFSVAKTVLATVAGVAARLGARVDGPYEIDEVTALPAAAPGSMWCLCRRPGRSSW